MQDGRAVPDAIIDQLFGKGLGYSDWEREITRQGYKWNENVMNQIIKREFGYFKNEILILEAQENTATGKHSPKTNSLESILKRIKGEKWLKKMPDEKAERLQNGRLFGRDAKVRSLQNYVSNWKKEASQAAASGQLSAGFSTGNNTEIEGLTSSPSYERILPFSPLSDLTSNSGLQSANASVIAVPQYIPRTNTFAATGTPGNSAGSQSGGARFTSDGDFVMQAPVHAQQTAPKPSWFSSTESTGLNAFSSGVNDSPGYAQDSDAVSPPPSFTQPSTSDSPSWRASIEQGNTNQVPEDNANGWVEWQLWDALDSESSPNKDLNPTGCQFSSAGEISEGRRDAGTQNCSRRD